MKTPDSYVSYLGHLFIVNDPPDRTLSRELAVWFHEMRVWDRVLFIDAGERDEACQYNNALKLALATSHSHFVFCDCDIRPHMEQMVKFWTAKFDVVGARYLTENADAWREGDEIHAALWRSRREVLEAIPPPWFLWEFDEEHTHVTKCPGRHFSDQAKAAGFSVGVAGVADHRPRGDFCSRRAGPDRPTA